MTVAIMAASGFAEGVICQRVINPQTGKPIDEKTLRRYFRAELDEGMQTSNALVAQALFKRATGGGPQSVTAAIFWLKCNAGWKETNALELTGKDGQPLPGVPSLSTDQFEKIARKLSEEV